MKSLLFQVFEWDSMTVWHHLSMVLWHVLTTYEKRLNCLNFVTTYRRSVHRQKGPPITAAFAASDSSYHHLNIWKLTESGHNVVTTFFLFSKCWSCLTHSHNASAVSQTFFCDSEYDHLSYPDPAFCLVITRNVPIFAHDKRGPWRRDWNMIIYSYVCWGIVVSVWPW